MIASQPTLYEASRMDMAEAIALTEQSLLAYGPEHQEWAVAYSGGKDSTALLSATVQLILAGRVPKPRKLYVLYGDTRMELPPLQAAAMGMMAKLRQFDWIDCRVVMAPLDQRYFVYMLGRGVPPPNNNTLRWCTAQIKVEPMEAELRRVADEATGKPLMLIGVRIGESAQRDARIALACSRNGAECGQGWYQRDLPDAVCDKLSPILHWRTCLIWDWLSIGTGHGVEIDNSFLEQTALVADAYGIAADGSAEELGARTGCVGCPLASDDIALRNICRMPRWSYLSPLMGLRPIYRELREPRNRLRQPPGESRKDGSLIANQNRMGPLTMKARAWALEGILSIQRECNLAAVGQGRPVVDILNDEEAMRIDELMRAGQWPNGWRGDEPIGDELYESQDQSGRQLLLPTINGRDDHHPTREIGGTP